LNEEDRALKLGVDDLRAEIARSDRT